MDIFKIYAERAIENENFRPLGSMEIHKTKACEFLFVYTIP